VNGTTGSCQQFPDRRNSPGSIQRRRRFHG